MSEVNTVCIPIDRYEELLNIETRVNVLIDRMDGEEIIANEDVYMTLGYLNKYRAIKEAERKRHEKYMRERASKCQESELATKNTENEKELAALT